MTKQISVLCIVTALSMMCAACSDNNTPNAAASATKTGSGGGGGDAKPSDGSGGDGGAKTTAVNGWLHWRGPLQTGVSLEKNLPEKVSLSDDTLLWSLDLHGRGTPVIANGRVYAWGYRGEGKDVVEVLACVDEETGKTIWEKEFADFLSDVIYDRYSIGAPTIDPDTGNVYLITSPGLFMCFTPDGKELWRHSMMEEFGRNTYPNGRTGAPKIDGNFVIVRGVSSNWGGEGPPRDRFYAFEKSSGQFVWSATAGVGPPYLKDSDFASVFIESRGGKRLFYTGLGSGSVVCIDGRTGKPVWRFQEGTGGINASPVLDGDILVLPHELNVAAPADDPLAAQIGSLIGLNVATTAGKVEGGIREIERQDIEVWRDKDIAMFTSSPVLVDGRVYQVDKKGVLWCVESKTGKKLWSKKMGLDQIHASPTWGDGKLYLPMNEGKFYIVKPGDTDAEILSEVDFTEPGAKVFCLGAPAIWNGKVYVYTTKRLYCFGKKGGNAEGLPAPVAPEPAPTPGEAVALQIVPAEVLLRPGKEQTFMVYKIDANGVRVGEAEDVKWARFVPPTAKVHAEMDADFNDAGVLVAKDDAKASAGAYKATSGSLSGTIRGRIVENLPYSEDFEGFKVAIDHPTDGEKFAYPPLQWIQARFRWEVRQRDGSNVLAKTTDNRILQRAITFIGHPSDSNYTLTADVMSDGNRRGMGDVGVINQRYIIVLKGNYNVIEVNSNQERVKESTSFSMTPKKWYRLKTRVDVADDGSGVIRAKVWPRDEDEPADWTIEVPHAHAHPNGSPGLFGFSSDEKYRVYIDNVKITPNTK